MAMAVANGGGSSGRRRRRAASRPMSEINVTPMVDVMLVLLIIFMVAAPLMTVGVPIDLPQTQAKQLNTQQKPITISVTSDGQIFVAAQPVALNDLAGQVAQLAQNSTEERIYVRGDTAANYGAVMQVMGTLSAAGYGHIGLITEQSRDK